MTLNLKISFMTEFVAAIVPCPICVVSCLLHCFWSLLLLFCACFHYYSYKRNGNIYLCGTVGETIIWIQDLYAYINRFAWDGMMLVRTTKTLRSGHKGVELMEVLDLRLSLSMQQMLVIIWHGFLIRDWFDKLDASQTGISGLVNALKLIQPIKDKYSGVTYADLFQLASATAIEVLPSPT